MHVDFEFTKNWGLIEKGTVKSLDRAFARSLQDMDKVGKILGDTKSKKEIETLEQAQAEMEVAVEERVDAVKRSADNQIAEADKKVVDAKAEAVKAQALAENKVQNVSKELKDMKAELVRANKELAASKKMIKVTQNKLDKAVKVRSTK